MKKNWVVGRSYKVIDYNEKSDERILRRLLEFGFTPNQSFVISHKSLTGQSLIVELRGFSLSLRTKFLSILKVK